MVWTIMYYSTRVLWLSVSRDATVVFKIALSIRIISSTPDDISMYFRQNISVRSARHLCPRSVSQAKYAHHSTCAHHRVAPGS